jgi:hypothetical protein
MPSEFGRCDREQHCRYWRKPDCDTSETINSGTVPSEYQPSFMQPDIMDASVQHWQRSTFGQWLQRLFGSELAQEAATTYHLGTSKHWKGANVFWQVDAHGRIHCGKVMLYGNDGRRVKAPYSHISWVHSVLKIKDFNLVQCYFGEHLLIKRPTSNVAIVESEKTAIVASIYFPQFIWVATGGKNGCRWKNDPRVNAAFSGRQVVLFPDLGAFDEWVVLSQRLSQAGVQVRMSDLLEVNAPTNDRVRGYDLADYLIQHPISIFRIDNTSNVLPNSPPTVPSINWNTLLTPADIETDPF